ncbi:uncharacterized protein LOC115998937 [Ipomoea triloba]|uniref:uncharacterized protein LOC115998937 n=1 Tax=Ipomoea triloba TaxID=35885 RepID=UPI00125D0F0A|nr:uncharacterized protein LOC115998937 [Ipomoea triloba]
MQDQRIGLPEDDLVPKSRKKKAAAQKKALSVQVGQKASKRGQTNEASMLFHKSEKPKQNSLAVDASTSGDEYRVLRRKYLLLEEESCTLQKELMLVEDETKALEEEKLSLLDDLVVLEGLVDPSEIQSRRQRL